MDEVKAIASLKKGDIAGLKTLVEMFQTDAVQAAYLVTCDWSMAEDIVQTAYLRVFEKIKYFDETRPFRPWFLRMVINDAIKVSMRQRRFVNLNEDGDEEYTFTLQKLAENQREPEDLLLQEELVSAMRKALFHLSPSQRAAIVMHYFLNLSTEDSANQLNCAPGTVRWRLSVARNRLRKSLDPFK